MQNTKRISEIEKQLPYGAKKEIANRTGISQATITRFFKGEISRMDKYDQIYLCALRIINEYKIRHARLYHELFDINE